MTCDIDANIIPRTGTLQSLVGGPGTTGISGNPGEIASTTDTQDIVKFNGVAGGAVSFSPGHNVLNLATNTDGYAFSAVTDPRLASAAYDRINVTVGIEVVLSVQLELPDGRYNGQRLEVSLRFNGTIPVDQGITMNIEGAGYASFVYLDNTLIIEWDATGALGGTSGAWRSLAGFALRPRGAGGSSSLAIFADGQPPFVAGLSSLAVGGTAGGESAVAVGYVIAMGNSSQIISSSSSASNIAYYPHVSARYTSSYGQWYDLILTGVTTSTTPTKLSNDNTPVTTPRAFENNPNELIHPSIAANGPADELWAMDVKFIGRNNSNPVQACLYRRQFLVTCDGTGTGAILAVVGMSTIGTDYDPSSLASAAPSVAPNATTKAIEFTVQGKASTTIQWVADVKWTAHTNRATAMGA